MVAPLTGSVGTNKRKKIDAAAASNKVFTWMFAVAHMWMRNRKSLYLCKPRYDAICKYTLKLEVVRLIVFGVAYVHMWLHS